MRHSRIVFWLGEASPHQSSYIRSLAELLPQTAVIGVFEMPLQSERYALGWQSAELGPVSVHVAPDDALIDKLAGRDPKSTVHIFGGFHRRMMRSAMRACAQTEAVLGVVSEPRRTTGWLGPARTLHSLFVERAYVGSLGFLLAIGHLGVRWFESCGYPARAVFPWGYFVENELPLQEIQGTHEMPETSPYQLVFIGQCIPRKGLDLLLRALAEVPRDTWHLRVVGNGAQRPAMESLAARLDIARHVTFVGVKPNSDVRSILARSDLLVLPSRFDGWGAVVNEALMRGVPVVCSESCGAADLVRDSDRGEIFPTGDVSELARAIVGWIAKGRLAPRRREKIRTWSRCIEGAAAARYLIRIIEHIEGDGPRPVAPWLSGQSTAALTGNA